ncbi:MAG: HDOD domain-containing protein [Bacteroidetes bacterium]|nr:HDOD domain-containing protein [Bacteroidota bacterium]
MQDIREEIEKINEIISFPTVIGQIISELMKEDKAAQKIVQMIETDAALTTRILSAANSSYYGIAEDVTTVQRAVMLLGFKEISQLILLFEMRQRLLLFSGEQKEFLTRLWKHGVSTAMIARFMAVYVDQPSSGVEFTAGLLHDIGKLVLAQNFSESLTLVQRMVVELGMKDVEAELQSLAINHCEIGALLTEKWALPPLIVDVIRSHHDISTATINRPFCALVRFADLLSERWKLGIGEQSSEIILEEEESWKILENFFPRLHNESADTFAQIMKTVYDNNSEIVSMMS